MSDGPPMGWYDPPETNPPVCDECETYWAVYQYKKHIYCRECMKVVMDKERAA